MEIYKVEELHKRYGKVAALEELNVSYRSGQFVALLGANGSGKSTLLRLLAQDEQPSGGAVFYHNQNLQSLRVNCREDVLFVTELHTLSLDISLEAWAKLFAKEYVRYDLTVFYDLMKRFDVDTDRYFGTLSRGQKMKALFALHAAKRPNVYLIDEITSVLDVGSRLELMTFLKKEVQVSGALVLMTTNIGSEMQSLATDVCYLHNGIMILNCPKSELKNLFVKYRATNKVMVELLVASPAKLIHMNSDGSQSFLIEKKANTNISGVEVDKREVTVEDVASFYSKQDVAHGY